MAQSTNINGRKVLVVEDDAGLRTQLKWTLADFNILMADNREAGQTLFERERPPVVVLDLGLPPDPNGASEGLALLEAMLTREPLTKVIVASGNEERANSLRAITLGAYDFYPKPIEPAVLLLIINRALRLHDLEAENLRLAKQSSTPLAGLVASSAPMIQLCRMVERVASANISVLITGESGTGKEVFARAIHDLSPRSDKMLIAINCAAIPETLLESELFGHEKGAFTGAVSQVVGKVERANGGTLFLDEIGDMPAALQAKLLRFLQSRVIERVGGHKQIEVDVRILSATNSDLTAKIKEGTFREDLYYRLKEVSIHVPPLREREGDAVLLAKYFLDKYTSTFKQPHKRFSPEALSAIAAYSWPGNVRELEGCVKRAVLMADGKNINASDLDLPAGAGNILMPTLREIREKAEEGALRRALALTDNNISHAAQLLDVSRTTMYDLMHAAGISSKRG